MRGENHDNTSFELRNLDYYFDNKHVLENINIKINQENFSICWSERGRQIYFTKSYTRAIAYTKGEIIVDGKPFKGNKSSLKISYVSQKLLPSMQVSQLVEVVLSGLTKTKIISKI